jgi:pimeloyl-ACP methyl ester carboxylesterase
MQGEHSMKRIFADTPEGQIYYQVDGSGEPVLLLHKASLSSEEFTDVLPLLGKHYRAIAMDVLGCGNSDQPGFTPAFEDYVRNTIHFLDALKIKKTNIVGRLFGASLAIEIAVKYPERVNKLVLLDCLHVPPEELEKARNDFKNETVLFKEDGSHLVGVWKGRGGRPGANLKMVQRATVEYLKSGLGTRAGDSHRAKVAYDVAPSLPKIKQPVLLLYSEKSHFFDRAAEGTKKLIPNCSSKLIKGTPAFPTWENPQEYAQAIIEFLQKP